MVVDEDDRESQRNSGRTKMAERKDVFSRVELLQI